MGYMGFGMRKEVYTRKPKVAFEKVKHIYQEKSKDNQRSGEFDYEGLKQYRKKSFLHLYKSSALLYFLILLIAGAIGLYVWSTWLSDIYNQYQQDKYEAQGISDFFNKNAEELKKVADFFIERNAKVVAIKPNFFYKSYILSVVSPGFNNATIEDSIARVGYTTEKDRHCKILNDNVIISREGFVTREFSGHWILNYFIAKPELIDKSITDYLDTDKSELLRIVNTIKKNDWVVESSNNSVEIRYRHDLFGGYSLLFFKQDGNVYMQSMLENNIVKASGVIEQNKVYWAR